jgi:hypothetical protein
MRTVDEDRRSANGRLRVIADLASAIAALAVAVTALIRLL